MNKNKKILHIAPQNFAGMPYDFVKMHQYFGLHSRLVTLYRNTLNFEEDISLNFSLPTTKLSKKWRDKKITFDNKYYKPKNIFENIFFKLRDKKNAKKIYDCIERYNLFDFDIYHFDGGMDLFRDLRFAKRIKTEGKKIICCYFGSDLRTRGLFKDLDEMSDLNLTVEFDHLKLHNNIHFIYFPFDVDKTEYIYKKKDTLKIIHSPTNRLFKGTDKILKVIEELKQHRKFEFILAENIDRYDLLQIKKQCNLAIDQVGGISGGTGYGKNSIENLSMGIPTITEFTDDYLYFINENPFIHCNIENLKNKLIEIIDNHEILDVKSVEGRKWVEKYHSFNSVNKRLNELYLRNNII